MRSFERTTICAVFAIAPFVGIGCIGLPFLSHSGPPKLTRKEAKIYAVQREKPLSAQSDTNKQASPNDESATTESPASAPENAENTTALTKVDDKVRAAKAIFKAQISQNEPVIAAAPTKSKQKMKDTSISKSSNEVSSPKTAVPVEKSTENLSVVSDDLEIKTESSRVELVRHEETAAIERVESTEPVGPTSSENEEVEFEMPMPVSSPASYTDASQKAWDAPDAEEIEESLESSSATKADEWTSPVGFEVELPKFHERDFQQFCLVTFREERTFTDGLPEFTVEYHAQRYRFSSAEAVEKFQANPEQFVPWAGGLDAVAFQSNQDVTQGSLDFAVWHKQRLYLFSNHQNVVTFQRQPEKFAATE